MHGNEQSIKKLTDRIQPQLESMEGAAFFSGCRRLSENYYQLRGISNYVEIRDKSKWNILLAISNVNTFAIKLIGNLNKM